MVERRPFGWTGAPVPVIGQGTWMMEVDPHAEVVEALRTGLDLGMTHLDTAEMYGNGRVEELVGLAIRGRRKEVFLVSKVLPRNATRKGTVRACERSLERLGTDHLDCYLLHWRGDVPLADTFAALEELVTVGKIRSWGVSNFDADDLAEALEVAGPGRIACDQVLYNLGGRQAERAALPWCKKYGAGLVGLQPVRARSISRSSGSGSPGPGEDRQGARRHPAAGGTGVPGARSARLRHSQVVEGRAGAVQCRGGRAPAFARGARGDRSGLPPGPRPHSRDLRGVPDLLLTGRPATPAPGGNSPAAP